MGGEVRWNCVGLCRGKEERKRVWTSLCAYRVWGCEVRKLTSLLHMHQFWVWQQTWNLKQSYDKTYVCYHGYNIWNYYSQYKYFTVYPPSTHTHTCTHTHTHTHSPLPCTHTHTHSDRWHRVRGWRKKRQNRNPTRTIALRPEKRYISISGYVQDHLGRNAWTYHVAVLKVYICCEIGLFQNGCSLVPSEDEQRKWSLWQN